MDNNLLNSLIIDEKKNNQDLYSAGPYWKKKSKKIFSQIKKYGLDNFRGLHNGIGTSYTDSLVYDIRNELNYPLKLLSFFYRMPVLSKIFDRQLHITSSYIKKYLKFQNSCYNNEQRIKDLIKQYKFINTTEFGCVRKVNIGGKEFSTNYLEVSNRNSIISKYINFNNIKSYVEIGGGFGSNIHYLLTNYNNIKKIIYLDIVPNIYVGTMYLKKFFGNAVIDYNKVRNLEKITFSKNDNLEIICLPPWSIEKLKISIDHFHNCASFVEMPKKTIENYSKYLYENNLKSFSLISYLDYDPITTFNPHELGNFFKGDFEKFEQPNLISNIKKKSLFIIQKSLDI